MNTTIKIKAAGRKFDLTPDEARALYDELRKVYDNAPRVNWELIPFNEPVHTEPDPGYWFQWPYQPTTVRTEPWTDCVITCDSRPSARAWYRGAVEVTKTHAEHM